MRQVMRFLEQLGAGVAPDGGAGYEDAVRSLLLEDQARDALLARDGTRLGELIEGRAQMFCMIFTPDETDREEYPDGDGPDEGETEREPKPE